MLLFQSSATHLDALLVDGANDDKPIVVGTYRSGGQTYGILI